MFKRRHHTLAHHLRASAQEGFVLLRWRTEAAGEICSRLLRSERDYPAASGAADGTTVVWEGTGTEYQDREVAGQRHYFYALYARGADGPWQFQARARVRAKFPPVDRSGIEARNVGIGAYPIPPTGH
jgi:hypothetical protein